MAAALAGDLGCAPGAGHRRRAAAATDAASPGPGLGPRPRARRGRAERRTPGAGGGGCTMSTETVLELVELGKSFGSLPVIGGVNLSVAEGERHAVIGPNGAGKSTLFNLISGLFPASAGEIRLRGRRISGLAPHDINRLGLSRSFQITNIFHRLSVFENLRIGVMARHGVRFGLFRRVERLDAVNREAREILERIRLADDGERAAGDL